DLPGGLRAQSGSLLRSLPAATARPGRPAQCPHLAAKPARQPGTGQRDNPCLRRILCQGAGPAAMNISAMTRQRLKGTVYAFSTLPTTDRDSVQELPCETAI